MQRLCLERHVEDKIKLLLLSGPTHFEGNAVDKCGAKLGGHGTANQEESFSLGALSLSVAIRAKKHLGKATSCG
jgi:hypothetical protein